MRFRKSIEQDNRFEGFAAYLRGRLGNTNDTRQLFRAVVAMNEDLARSPLWRSDVEEPPKPRVPPGFPWITVVLGSGATGSGLRDDGLPLARRIAGFPALLDGPHPLPDGLAHGELAQHFARALVKERIDEPWPDVDGADTLIMLTGSEATDRRELATAQLVLAVALLTRLHHEVMASQMTPVPRWEDDDSREVNKDLRRSRLLDVALAEPAEALLEEMTQANDLKHPVNALLEDRLEELRQGRVASLASIRLLTECCWYFLVRGCLNYPGWSDVMLGLTFGFDPPIPHQDGRARPLFPSVLSSDLELEEQYRDVTRASWAARTSSAEKSSTLHDAVAQVLVHQAALQGRNPGPGTLPLASAFVTGFDLELELALLAAGQPFVLAVPAFVEAEGGVNNSEVSVVWLGRVVESPPEEGAELPIFSDGSWFLLSGAPQFGTTEDHHRNLPVVVRLAGCPAVSLPDLASDRTLHQRVSELVPADIGTRSAPARRPTVQYRLHPAFVLDEYMASVLGATENFLDHLEHARLGLPRWITGAPGGVNARFARFWLVLGAQLSDSSIRQRIVAQITSPSLHSASPSARPERTGLIVNRRIGRLDGLVMQWQGFDIVRDRCEELTDQLLHYVEHLGHLNLRCEPGRSCGTARNRT